MKEYNGVSEGRAEATPELIVYGQQSRCLVSEFVPWEPAMRPPETPAWPALPEVNGLSALGVATCIGCMQALGVLGPSFS